MRESELREHAICSHCGKKIGHTGIPLFWTAKLIRWGIDGAAVRRSSGLAMAMGSAALAQVMGPDEEMAQEIENEDLTLCEECALPLMTIIEKYNQQKEKLS